MALDNEDYPFKSASPIATSGLDVDALLAQDPETMAQARAMGLPMPSPATVATAAPIQTPAARNVPTASGTAALQVTSPSQAAPQPAQTPDDGTRGMMPNFGANLAQSQVPANNSPATPGETPASPTVPATVTPSGTPEDPNQAGIQRAGQMAESFATKLQNAPTLQQTLAPMEAQRRTIAAPIMPNDPDHPEYRPTVGQRIIRGLQGFARGGIGGVIDPTIKGGTAYGAPTRAFSLAAQKQSGLLANIDQQEKQATDTFKADTGQAKDIITSINDIGKNYAAGQSSQARLDTAAAREETAKVAGQLSDIKQQVADFQSQGKTPTTYEATVAAAHLEKDPVKAAALEAAAKEMAATEVKKFRSVAGAGGSTFRQSLIDAATAEVQALQDKYHYDPRRNQYVNPDNPNDILDPNEFTDKKNEIATKLDAQLGAKKMDKLGVRFDPADAGANKPSGRAVRQQPANKPKPPTPTAPPPQGAVDMALGSDGQYHYRDGSKKDLGVVK